MPSSLLKRAERAIQTIRDRAELPPETADALHEIVDVIRTMRAVCRRWKAKDICALQRRWNCQIGDDDRPHRVAACVTALAIASAMLINGLE
jgi:hypothetical protein